MKYSTVILATVGIVSAQSPGDFIPECALECLEQAAAAVTDCGEGDYECRCEPANQSALRIEATPCVIEECGADVAIQEVLPAAEEFCEAVASGGGQTTEEPTEEPTDTMEPTMTGTEEPTATDSDTMEPTMTMTTMTSDAPEPTGSDTDPTPTSFTTAGAASLGSIGGVAALFLAALAAF